MRNEYVNMKDSDGNIIAVWHRSAFDNAKIDKDMQGKNVFTFTLWKSEDERENALKFDIVEKGSIFEIVGRDFTTEYIVSKIIKKRDGATIVKEVECLDISDILVDETYAGFNFVGDFQGLFTLLNIDTLGFSYVIDTDLVQFELSYTNETNVKQILVDTFKKLGKFWQLKGRQFVIGNTFGFDKGAYITVGKNLEGFDSEVDENNVIYYRVDVLELESSSERTGTKFEYLDELELDDFVYLKDEDMGLDEIVRLLAYSFNPFNKMDSNIELSNITLDISDTMITKDNLASEILNNPEVKKEIQAIGSGGGAGVLGDDNNNLQFKDDVCDPNTHTELLKELILTLDTHEVQGTCYDDITKILRYNILGNHVTHFKIGWNPSATDGENKKLTPELEFDVNNGFKFQFTDTDGTVHGTKMFLNKDSGFEVVHENTRILIDVDGNLLISNSTDGWSIGYNKFIGDLTLQSTPTGKLNLDGNVYINGVLQ